MGYLPPDFVPNLQLVPPRAPPRCRDLQVLPSPAVPTEPLTRPLRVSHAPTSARAVPVGPCHQLSQSSQSTELAELSEQASSRIQQLGFPGSTVPRPGRIRSAGCDLNLHRRTLFQLRITITSGALTPGAQPSPAQSASRASPSKLTGDWESVRPGRLELSTASRCPRPQHRRQIAICFP